jgi:hypothetical protein
MNRLSITRKIAMFMLDHPKALRAYSKVVKKKPTLPKGYRKIVK